MAESFFRSRIIPNPASCVNAAGQDHVEAMSEPLIETPPQRLTRYRKLAAQAMEMAGKSYSSELKDAYSALAESWNALARDLAKAIERGEET